MEGRQGVDALWWAIVPAVVCRARCSGRRSFTDGTRTNSDSERQRARVVRKNAKNQRPELAGRRCWEGREWVESEFISSDKIIITPPGRKFSVSNNDKDGERPILKAHATFSVGGEARR